MTSAPTALNDRARGWLRFVWDKATTPDDWSSAGEPLPWWDRDSTAPMCAFPRFDLGETSYTLPLMADLTPAWREVYTRIVDELCQRHTTFWAAIDWITLVGDDPYVDRYPPEWQVFMPENLRGKYAPPAWTGNGAARWGLNPDPIGADGNLFFRGFFNLLLSISAYVSGGDRWRSPFEVTGYQDRTFTWTHQDIAGFISAQLAARPEGPHCENTKIWPFCVSSAGLGLKLYDAIHGTTLQSPYEAWTEFAETHYMGLDRKGELDWFALYYDPIEKQASSFPYNLAAYASLCVVPYILPQRPDLGTKLYELSLRKLGWSNPRARVNQFLPDPRFLSIALFMAHELGDTATANRLDAYAEDHFEPRFFGDENTRFGYFFDWDEPYPRGQQNALLLMPEIAGPGAWSATCDHADRSRFSEPTVEGVDYPNLGISAARNDHTTGELLVTTYAATPSQRGRESRWRVSQIPDPPNVQVTCDGQTFTGWRPTDDHTIEITLDVDDHNLRIHTGYHPGQPAPVPSKDAHQGSASPTPGTHPRVTPPAAPPTCCC